ncbi:MAG: hypothetical protein IJ800_00275 [Clostridia bacterium]|nr:hypothetical protein [Clostridia bacterium]
MKDGMEYAEMLEMPVSTCDVVFKPAKRKKRKSLKDEVIAKVNGFARKKDDNKKEEDLTEEVQSEIDEKTEEVVRTRTKRAKDKKPRKKFKFDLIYAEGAAVFLLVSAILLTNVFWEDSGINTIFKKAFGISAVTTDSRTYANFSAKSPSEELDADLSEGVMTFSGKGAIYPVCEGKVSSIEKGEDGKYTLTVNHSDVFKTVISGVDYVYADEGEEAYKYIPIAFLNEGSASVKLYNDGTLLTGYLLENGSIIWES